MKEKRLRLFFRLLWVRRNLIFGTWLFFLLFALLLVSLQTAFYSATAVVRFSPAAYEIENATLITKDLPSSSSLRKQQIAMLRSERMIAPAIEKYNLAERNEFLSTDNIYKKILKTLTTEESQTRPFDFNITYESPSPHLAQAIANSIAENYTHANITEAKKEWVSEAVLPDAPYYPRAKEILSAFAALGLLAGCFLSAKLQPPPANGQRM